MRPGNVPGYAVLMNEFLQSFVKGPDGSWTCIRDCVYTYGRTDVHLLTGENFRIGKLVKGVEIAHVLERHHDFTNGL
jgi:hypothetical protein